MAEVSAEYLIEIAHGRTKFAAFGDDRIADASGAFARYGLETAEAFRKTDERARKYPFEDIRWAEQLNFLQLGFALMLAFHIRPIDR